MVETNLIRVTISLKNSSPVKVAWPYGCSDERVEEAICMAVGCSRNRILLVDPTDGSLIPACSQLPAGSTFKLTTFFDGSAAIHGGGISTAASGRCRGEPETQAQRRTEESTPVTPPTTVADLSQPLLFESPETMTDIRRLEDRLIKFERMSSHLANERTFLAWIRTTVSVAGLAVTFTELFTEPRNRGFFFWAGSTFAWMVGVAVFSIGVSRYQTVKAVLNMPKNAISNRFGRVGIIFISTSFAAFLCALTAAYMLALYYRR